jgi:hypothetical protein
MHERQCMGVCLRNQGRGEVGWGGGSKIGGGGKTYIRGRGGRGEIISNGRMIVRKFAYR